MRIQQSSSASISSSVESSILLLGKRPKDQKLYRSLQKRAYVRNADNLRYGRLRIDDVRQFQHKAPKGKSTDFIVKKVFLNYYNNALKFDNYRITNQLRDNQWTFSTNCLYRCSYKYILEWVKWHRSGKWMKSDSDVPASFQRARIFGNVRWETKNLMYDLT